MKKLLNQGSPGGLFFKLLLRMKLTMLLVMIGLISFGSASYSQSSKLNISMKNRSLLDFIQEIEKQTDFYFFYQKEDISDMQNISIDESNADIKDILNSVFKNSGYNYEIIDRYIVLRKAGKDFDLPANSAQAKDISGIITDENKEPLPGVAVMVKGTNSGTVTDFDGKFALTSVSPTDILIVSFVGMKTQEVVVGTQTFLQIAMQIDAIGIDEIVAVGYGVQKKANLTGAVGQVQMDKVLGERPVTNLTSALQGTIPGLQVTGGVVPGSSRTINIRGINSINGGSPLVLIDNVPGSIDLINPEDIESVSVLKDAASAAIYGARGAFGVILINTKRAKKNSKLSINYNTNFAYQKSVNEPKSASVEQVLQTYIDWDNDGKYYAQEQNLQKWLGYVQEYNADPNGFTAKYPGAYFDDGKFVPAGESAFYYLKDSQPALGILDKYGFQQTHNLSASGGSDKITYRMSLGYTNQDGPLVTNKDNFTRTNLTSFVKGDITEWLSQSIDVSFAKSQREYVENGNVYKTTPPAFFPTGSMPLGKDLTGLSYPTNSPENYLRLSNPSHWLTENTRVFSWTSIHPVTGLEAIFEYTYDSNASDYKRYTNNAKMIMMEQGIENLSTTPTYYNNKQSIVTNAINAYATYQKEIGENHSFKVMAGYNQETRNLELLQVNRTDMINPDLPSFSSATGIIKANDTYKQYAIRSGFFRFNYNFKEKYLLEVNGRYDGSSKFPTNTRFGFFPSVSAGWQIGHEKFMNWSDKWLNEFKLRASWGQLGNQAGVEEYGYMPTMDSFLAEWIVDGARPTSLYPPGLVRSNYTWEIVETLDFGADLSLFNSRLSTSFDWYQRNTKGMLAPGLELPSVVGAQAPDQNAADLQTKGWELSLQWRDKVGEWSYGAGFNIYDSKTVITKYDNEAGLFYNSSTNSNYRKGMEINEIWGYVTDGFYSADDFTSTSNWTLKPEIVSLNGYTPKAGDVKFKDLNDDKTISIGDNTVFSPGDRKIIGNSTPRYQYGANANIGWRNFDLSVLVQGTGKRDYWLAGDLMFGPVVHYGNVYTNQLDYWKPADWKNGDYTAVNPNAFYPRIYGENTNSASNYRVQTKYLSNAAYLRLKNITLSYNIPARILQRAKISSGKLFFSGENMLTKSNLPKGVDPERVNWGYPFYATYSFGFSITL